MTLRIASRVRTAIATQSAGSPSRVGCGLLIGFREGGAAWVERSLPCVNAAPPESRAESFEIDPRVLVNVTRSLVSTPQSIVGFYYTNLSGSRTLGERDRELLELWPNTALLVHGPADSHGETLQAWWRSPDSEEASELGIEIVKMRESSLLVCPE